jgi:hypothetical protein
VAAVRWIVRSAGDAKVGAEGALISIALATIRARPIRRRTDSSDWRTGGEGTSLCLATACQAARYTLATPRRRRLGWTRQRVSLQKITREGAFSDRCSSMKKMARRFWSGSCLVCILGFSSATGETVTFNFAQVGSSFSAFLPADSPLIGLEVVSARIYLDVESFKGSDAANFFTDLSFPILPFKGNENAIAIFGDDLGWSGSGVFHFFQETTMFNGTFVPGRYGGETPGKGFDGTILKGSRVEFDFVPEPRSLSLILVGGVALIGLRARFRPR